MAEPTFQARAGAGTGRHAGGLRHGGGAQTTRARGGVTGCSASCISTIDTPRAVMFREFLRERGEPLQLHALFDALDRPSRARRRHGARLAQLAHGVSRPNSEAVRVSRRTCRMTWSSSPGCSGSRPDSWAPCARRRASSGLNVGLYGDYAVGVNASGSETWSDQTLYCMGAAIGAPPDPLGVAGQEWGIPPQDPRQLRRTAYAPFAALVRASMRNCGALRLDHVMALFRQWWVPRGFKSVDGGYVHYPLEDLLGVVALESHRNQCLDRRRGSGRRAGRDPPRVAAVRRVSLQGGDVRADATASSSRRRTTCAARWPP